MISVSWSALRRWENCGQRFLRVSQGRSRPNTDGRIFLPGTVADRLMRAWLNTPDPQPGWMDEHAEAFLAYFADPKTDDPDAYAVIRWRGDPREDRANVLQLVREVVGGLEPILSKLVLPHRYEPELKFRVPIRIPGPDGEPMTIALRGGIDIAVQELPSEDFALYDLKATKDPGYINHVVGQGIFYDIAFGHWIGQPEQPKQFGFITPAVPEKIMWTTITDDDRRAMLSRIIRFVHGRLQADFLPKEDDDGCGWCEVKHACDKFVVPVHVDQAGMNRVSFAEAALRRTKKRADRTPSGASSPGG